MTLRELIEKAGNESSTKLTCGERLQTIRQLRGFKSQREVAAKIGIQPSTLNAYERDRLLPNPRIAIKIAGIYNCSLDWLYGLDEEIGGKNDE